MRGRGEVAESTDPAVETAWKKRTCHEVRALIRTAGIYLVLSGGYERPQRYFLTVGQKSGRSSFGSRNT
jgi:hypothetical protein